MDFKADGPENVVNIKVIGIGGAGNNVVNRMVKAGTRSNGKNTYVDKAGTADHRIFSEPMTLLYGCSATAIPQN